VIQLNSIPGNIGLISSEKCRNDLYQYIEAIEYIPRPAVRMEKPMTDRHILEAWYRYAAGTAGFIGGALRTQRTKAFQLQEQQRARIGIQGEQYNDLWLRLQAMPLPRSDQFAADLARIVAKVQLDLGIMATIDLEQLGKLIQDGLA
jgi:hypothetical protein